MTKRIYINISRNTLAINFRLIGLLLFALFFIPGESLAQKKKGQVEKYKFFSGSLSYYAPPDKFAIVTKNPFPFPKTTLITQPETSVINLGFSFQSMKDNFVFQEFSLNRLSLLKVEKSITGEQQTGPSSFFTEFIQGSNTLSFVAGLRYEYGKYFAKDIGDKFKFGIAGAFEPTYLFHKYEPLTSNAFSNTMHKFSFDLAIIPRCSFNFSEKMSLIVKLIPNTRIASVGRVRTNNPSLTLRRQRQPINGETLDFNLSGSLQLCYLFNEPVRDKKKRKKKRRRKR